MERDIVYRGISRAFSDLSVKDGGCAESVNVFIDGGEVGVLANPKVVDSLPQNEKYDILYMHTTGATTQHIGIKGNAIGMVRSLKVPGPIVPSSATSYGTQKDGPVQIKEFNEFLYLDSDEKILSIKSLKYTLVIATQKRMIYCLFKDGQYKVLGSKIPEPDITIWRLDVPNNYVIPEGQGEKVGEYELSITGALEAGEKDYKTEMISVGGYKNPYYAINEGLDFDFSFRLYKDINKIEGWFSLASDFFPAYTEVVNEARQFFSKVLWDRIAVMYGDYNKIGVLIKPIFVRFALRLYDGTYISQSSPILIGAEQSLPFEIKYGPVKEYENVTISYLTFFLKLEYRLFADVKHKAELDDWKDIVKGIDFFISEPIDIIPPGTDLVAIKDKKFIFDEQSEKELETTLLSKANFYLIHQLEIEDLKGNKRIEFTDDLKKYLGDLLPTQPKLEDGFRSLHGILPEVMFEYNSRLNLASLSYDYYQGPPYMTSFEKLMVRSTDFSPQWHFYYFIKGENGREYIRKRIVNQVKLYMFEDENGIIEDSYNIGIPGQWLTYPDTRCTRIEMYHSEDGVVQKWSYTMKEHPFLSCAYHFLGFGKNFYVQGAVSEMPDYEIAGTEYMKGLIYQSEVSNPYIYKPQNIHTLPVSKILGMATTSQTLSQEAYGGYQVYVFSTDGIWACKVGQTGEYTSIYPISRDVCINPASITGIDGAIVFVTAKGVMLIAANKIQCISENMNGRHFVLDDLQGALEHINYISATRWMSDVPDITSDGIPFMDYISRCFIAYDYGNRRLYFVNAESRYQYMYCMDSGTWHKICLSKKFKRTYNPHQNCHIQAEEDSGDKVYNFSLLSDPNSIDERNFGLIVTRAIDLERPNVMKTIMRILHRGSYADGSVGMLLYGSLYNKHYYLVNSLKASSFKTFRIVLFMNFRPVERLSYTSVSFLERWTGRIR